MNKGSLVTIKGRKAYNAMMEPSRIGIVISREEHKNYTLFGVLLETGEVVEKVTSELDPIV